MKRREFNNRLKAEIIERSMNAAGRICCEGCGLVLGEKPYHVDHITAEALERDKAKPLTAKDGQLLGVECCHNPKTVNDVRRIAKAVRQRNRNIGIKKRSSWNTKLRRKMNGEVVAR